MNSATSHSIPVDAATTSATTMTRSSTPSLEISPTLLRWNSLLPAPLSQVTLTHLVAGALARLSSAAITAPLDNIKVRAQFSQNAIGVRQYRNGFDTARCMWQNEGVMAFYRGLPARLVYVGPAAAISFVFYEQFRVLFHSTAEERKQKAHSPFLIVVPILLGGAARILGTVVRTPFDVVKQRMQIQGGLVGYQELVKQPLETRKYGIYKHSGEALMRVSKVEGVKTLWSGLGATVARDLPFAAVYFLAYESSKTFQIRYLSHLDHLPLVADSKAKSNQTDSRIAYPRDSNMSDNVDLSTTASTLSPPLHAQLPTNSASSKPHSSSVTLSAPRCMMSGAFAASVAVLVTMPMDVVKTRLQTQGSLEVKKYRGFFHCFKLIAQEEGIKGFFKGSIPRLCYLMPASALTFSLYEKYKKELQQYFHLEDQVKIKY